MNDNRTEIPPVTQTEWRNKILRWNRSRRIDERQQDRDSASYADGMAKQNFAVEPQPPHRINEQWTI